MAEMNWLGKVKGLFSESKVTEHLSEEQSREKILNKSSKWQMLKIDLQVLENDLSKEYIGLGQEFYKKTKKKPNEKKLKGHIAAIDKIQKSILHKKEIVKNLEKNLLKSRTLEQKMPPIATESFRPKTSTTKKTKKVKKVSSPSKSSIVGQTVAKISKRIIAKKPAVKKVVAKKPAVKKVVAKKPAVKKVVAKKSAVKKVVAKKSAVKKVVAKKSAVKKG